MPNTAQRETQLLETTTGHKVELHTYITGREKRAIESVFYRDVEMTQTGAEQTIKGFKGAALEEAQNAAITAVVVSVDGNTSNVLDRVLDLPAVDYQEVIAAINEITEGKKKAPSTETP